MADTQPNPNLTDEQKHVLFNKGTEAPFTGDLLTNNKAGTYSCVNCGTTLFTSETKYESDIAGLAGWPSFAEAVSADVIELSDDTSFGMHRTEVTCKKCGGHLGHIFDDESSPSGKHYCINSVCLAFEDTSATN